MLNYFGKRSGSAGENYWMVRMGKDLAQRDAESPALHADRITAPVLLIHSEHDITVPIAQSEIMEQALEKAGKKSNSSACPATITTWRSNKPACAFCRNWSSFSRRISGTDGSL